MSCDCVCSVAFPYDAVVGLHCEELLAIRRIFSLVDMIKNIKFSNFLNVFKIGVVQQ